MARLPAGISKRERKNRKTGKSYFFYESRFTVDGTRYSVYGNSVKECREKELKKREEIEQAAAHAKEDRGANITLDKYFEEWLKGKEGCVKPTTIRSSRMMYKNISAAPIGASGVTFGSMKLSDIEARDVKKLQTMLKERLSTRTTNDTVSMLSSILESAVNERVLEWNPARAVKALKRTEPRAADTIHRALTRTETSDFLQAAQDMKSWYCNLYVFLLHTGARVGEAGALTPSDLSVNEAQIHKTVTRTELGGYEIGQDTKTAAGRRIVPLDNEARQAAAAQRRIEKLLRGTTGKVADFSEVIEPIFKTPTGQILRSSLVNDDIKRICDKIGIERFSVHAFRDTFATRCVESGMDVKQLQSIMGHTNIAMTLGLYAHADDERKAQQLRAVNFV